MAAGGGADDPDAMRVNRPIRSMRPHVPERAGDIEEHCRIMITVAAETISKDERGNPICIEKTGVAFALMRREMRIASPGADEERRAGGFPGGRGIRGDRRYIHRSAAERSGSALRPEGNRRGGSRRRGWLGKGGGDRKGHEQEGEAHKVMEIMKGQSFSRWRDGMQNA